MYTLGKLRATALKIFYIICYESERGELKNMESLLKYGMSYPTILEGVETLVKNKMIAKSVEPTTDGQTSIMKLLMPYSEYAEHIKKYAYLFICDAKPKAEKKKTNPEEAAAIRKIVAHYGYCKGETRETMGVWFKRSIKKFYNPAKDLLDYAKSYEGAVNVLNRAKNHYEGRGLSWSLPGAVLDNIAMFLTGDGPKEETIAVKNVISMYKMLKGLNKNDRAWNDRYHARACLAAVSLLKQFDGEWKPAVTYMEEEVKYLRGENLGWNLDTLINRVGEWRLRKKEEKIRNDRN